MKKKFCHVGNVTYFGLMDSVNLDILRGLLPNQHKTQFP